MYLNTGEPTHFRVSSGTFDATAIAIVSKELSPSLLGRL